MPKQKTHKGLRKRVKVTASGKIKHGNSGGGHLMSSKSSKKRRNIRKDSITTGTSAAKTRALLCE
jgi:large subunit ribosomal protein L35